MQGDQRDRGVRLFLERIEIRGVLFDQIEADLGVRFQRDVPDLVEKTQSYDSVLALLFAVLLSPLLAAQEPAAPAKKLTVVIKPGYVNSLDDDQFRRALVFLRRAFGGFSPQEKRHIAENLGEYWGVHADTASELIEQPLTEKEEQTLSDLNEFDFGDL